MMIIKKYVLLIKHENEIKQITKNCPTDRKQVDKKTSIQYL